MKYSALRNPHSTSCYGILSDLFWGGYTRRIPVPYPRRVHREGTRLAPVGLPVAAHRHTQRTRNDQYLVLNHSRV